jgi:ABC-type nitrate/sulfonate/bicarbonate transport system permease component
MIPLLTLILRLGAFQAIVQQTNCPQTLIPGTIVAAQSVATVANYPVVILACYTLDPNVFTINTTTTPPTITAIINGTGNFSDSEVPSGTINGINATFTLMNTPINGSLHVFLDGLRMRPGADYTITGSTIQFTSTIPQNGGTLLVDYMYN